MLASKYRMAAVQCCLLNSFSMMRLDNCVQLTCSLVGSRHAATGQAVVIPRRSWTNAFDTRSRHAATLREGGRLMLLPYERGKGNAITLRQLDRLMLHYEIYE